MTSNFFRERGQDSQFPHCPKHPDQMAYTRCSRCSRHMCTGCQLPAEVGMICSDCAVARTATAQRKRSGTSIWITYILIAINLIVYLLQQLIPNSLVIFSLLYNPLYVEFTGQWWRALTAGFVHDQTNLTHLLLNMFSLWLFGRAIEPALGKIKYLLVYLLSIIGGSVGVWLIGLMIDDLFYTNTVGASGGIFGLFGAFFILTKLRGADTTPIVILIAINLIYGFIVPGISWQAHLGGLLTGLFVTWLLQKAGFINNEQG